MCLIEMWVAAAVGFALGMFVSSILVAGRRVFTPPEE